MREREGGDVYGWSNLDNKLIIFKLLNSYIN